MMKQWGPLLIERVQVVIVNVQDEMPAPVGVDRLNNINQALPRLAFTPSPVFGRRSSMSATLPDTTEDTMNEKNWKVQPFLIYL